MAKATTISIKNFLKTTIHPRLQDGVFWLVFINHIYCLLIISLFINFLKWLLLKSYCRVVENEALH